MHLERLGILLLKSSEESFERVEELWLMVNLQIFVYAISPFLNMLKIVEVGHFVERTLLYKMSYSTAL